MPLQFIHYKKFNSLLDRARAFLNDVETNIDFVELWQRDLLTKASINRVLMETVNECVRSIIHETDAYKQACEKIEKHENQDEHKAAELRIANDLASEINGYQPEIRLAFLFNGHYTEPDLKAIFKKRIEATVSPGEITLERARTFLKDVEDLLKDDKINDIFLLILSGHAYDMVFNGEARDKACEEGRDENYQHEIAENISGNINSDSCEYQVAFLFDHGMKEDQLKDELKAEISSETTPYP